MSLAWVSGRADHVLPLELFRGMAVSWLKSFALASDWILFRFLFFTLKALSRLAGGRSAANTRDIREKARVLGPRGVTPWDLLNGRRLRPFQGRGGRRDIEFRLVSLRFKPPANRCDPFRIKEMTHPAWLDRDYLFTRKKDGQPGYVPHRGFEEDSFDDSKTSRASPRNVSTFRPKPEWRVGENLPACSVCSLLVLESV